MDETKKRVLFSDTEVFMYDSLCVIKTAEHKTLLKAWNDDPKRPEKIAELLKGSVVIGYNNYSYDDKIITYMMDSGKTQEDIKRLNDDIISGKNPKIKIDSRIESLDCMQQISIGLKQIEGNLGMSIRESDIPFDIARPLTAAEREETERYCSHDVDATIEVYNLRKASYFDVKAKLLEMLPEKDRKKAQRWNTTTIAGNLLAEKNPSPWSAPKVPDRFWRQCKYIPEEVWAYWESIDLAYLKKKAEENRNKKDAEQDNVKISISVFGCKVTFGLGGLHGAPVNPEVFTDVFDADVSSMYPSIIAHPEIRALGDKTDIYDQMRKDRISCKKTDPVRASALKLILNSVYGNLKNKYSSLNNPCAAVTICIYGQIAAIDLSGMLFEAGYRIVNINTDGIMFIPNPEAVRDYNDIFSEWQNKYGLGLETEHFSRMIQRDVNNYIAITDDGKIKAKGGDCNKYAENHPFKNDDCRIIQLAIVNYLAKGIPIEDTFAARMDEPQLWQYVLTRGDKFRAVRDAAGNDMNNTNRVFAGKPGIEGITNLKKYKADGASSSFADAPENMYVWNDALSDLKNFADVIDTTHYKTIAEKKIKAWTKREEDTTSEKPKKAARKKKSAEAAPDPEAPEAEPEVKVAPVDLLESVAQHFMNPRRKSSSEWIAFCPIHEADGEHNPSLAIYEDKRGKGIRCTCRSQHCKESEILKAVGLKYSDLGRIQRECSDWKSKLARDLSQQNGGADIRITADYDYTEANGEYLWTKVRYYTGTDPEKKMIFIRKAEDTDDLYYEGIGRRLHPDKVLYNLPELIRAIIRGFPVYYVEGEKDVETLRALGKTATTAGSANDWSESMRFWFRGATVTIFADNDDIGKDSAEKIRKSIAKAAFATRVFVPSAQPKGDITDYLNGEGDWDSVEAKLANRVNEYQYAYWTEKKDTKGRDEPVSISGINEGCLAQCIEENENYKILVQPGRTREDLYMYTGRCYQQTEESLFSLVKKYVPAYLSKAARIKAAAELLREGSHRELSNNIDYQTDIIITENGVLDLNRKTQEGKFELLAHSPKYEITTCIHTKYDPDAACPTFMKWINDLCTTFDGSVDAEKMKSIQEYCGLVISNIEVFKTKKSLWFHSTQGNTGKSQLLKVLVALLGDDKVCNVHISEMNRGQNRFALSTIVGKRLIQIPDMSECTIEDSSVFKQLLGNDTIAIEHKGSDQYDYKFRGGLIVCSNGYPIFKDDKGDHIAERMVIIPCDHFITEEDRDIDIADKMLQELPGVLNWMLEGLDRFLTNRRLTISQASRNAIGEYKAQTDSVFRYLTENYTVTHNPKDRVLKSDFDDGYTEWYKANFDEDEYKYAVRARNIKDRLEGHGVVQKQGRVGNKTNSSYYSGIIPKA